jgi:hypothetical protein
MGSIVKSIGSAFGFGGGESDAPKDAAEIQAGYQREALEYLKGTEALPQEYREGALTQLAGAYGLRGQDEEQAIIDRARQSPLYGAIMGGREAGEEAIMRQAGATGGLRSGNVQANLYDYNTQLENKALLQSYNQQIQGLGGLANLPSLAPQIAQGTAGIGQTLAQGEIGAAQTGQATQQQGIGNIMGIANLGLQAYGSGMFSDRRLKDDIVHVGDNNGHKWYVWKWNKLANRLGLDGSCSGVMADEAHTKQPDAVKIKDGFLYVNYSALGVM